LFLPFGSWGNIPSEGLKGHIAPTSMVQTAADQINSVYSCRVVKEPSFVEATEGKPPAFREEETYSRVELLQPEKKMIILLNGHSLSMCVKCN
jgi:hypothetical protein